MEGSRIRNEKISGYVWILLSNLCGLLSKFPLLPGDGRVSIDEVGSPRFLLMTSACWNGIAMGSVDIARRHVTTKEHADIGMRIADYPTVQVGRQNNNRLSGY